MSSELKYLRTVQTECPIGYCSLFRNHERFRLRANLPWCSEGIGCYEVSTATLPWSVIASLVSILASSSVSTQSPWRYGNSNCATCTRIATSAGTVNVQGYPAHLQKLSPKQVYAHLSCFAHPFGVCFFLRSMDWHLRGIHAFHKDRVMESYCV